MATLTDPATELADVAARLEISSNTTGAKFLAKEFGVSVWSSQFFRIVTCVLERCDQVREIIEESSLDEPAKDRAIGDVKGFATAFTGVSLINSWNTAGNGLTAMTNHGVRLSYLQQTVRPVIQYPKLNVDEIAELIGLVDIYLLELEKGDESPVFVKQAIKDGLMALRFQLEYVGWAGSGYLLSSFKAIVRVAEESYRFYEAQPNCDPEAMLSMMFSLVHRFREVIETVKPYTEAASYAYSGYTIMKPYVAPLLASSNLLIGPPGN